MNPKAAQAIQSLSRIRAAETRDADGLRRVWHQGLDVDLLSHVDAQGRLQRQELTLFGDSFLWTPELGLRTGRVESVEAATTANASDLVCADPGPDVDRLGRAAEALAGYTGEDRYVLHLKQAIGQLLRGLQERGQVVITVTQEVPQSDGASSTPAPTGGRVRWLAGAALALAALAAVLLALR